MPPKGTTMDKIFRWETAHDRARSSASSAQLTLCPCLYPNLCLSPCVRAIRAGANPRLCAPPPALPLPSAAPCPRLLSPHRLSRISTRLCGA